MLFVNKHINGICEKGALAGIGGDLPPAIVGKITISASVGKGGVNLPHDTVTIQNALNQVPLGKGRPNPLLAVDAKCGPKTIKAIGEFQLKHFGWSGADSLVEPNRQTIKKLNEVLGTSLAAKPGTASPLLQPVVLPDLTPGLTRARKYISNAQRHLDFASSVVDGADSAGTATREEKMRMLNKHYSIDNIPALFRRRVFNIIRNVFFRMDQVFRRPGGLWGAEAFEPDPSNNKKELAFTNFGGYFRNGQRGFTPKGVPIRFDTIYICAAFSTLTNVDEQALLHIHELAHFTGSPELIDDHAYNFQGDKINRLPPPLKVLNAESYSNFAWEVSNPGTRPPL